MPPKRTVYILQSLAYPDQFYTGLCSDVEARLQAHNAGQSPHTAKYKPWPIVSAHHFEDGAVAAAFERYLKAGPGARSPQNAYADHMTSV